MKRNLGEDKRDTSRLLYATKKLTRNRGKIIARIKRRRHDHIKQIDVLYIICDVLLSTSLEIM